MWKKYMYASISVTNNMPCLPAIAIDDKANAKILTSPNKIFIFEPPQKTENMLGKLPPNKIVPMGVNTIRGNNS